MNDLRHLLLEIQHNVDTQRQIREERYSHGECFNIFNVLGLSTNETRTHSAFIAELLNPKGSHGCGYEFLHGFIELFVDDTFSKEELNNAQVDIEKNIGNKNRYETKGGRIDIMITIGKLLVIIENKIYAPDQPKQLLRYSNYAKSCIGIRQISNYKLFYLTLYGEEASEISTCNKIKPGIDYSCISYATDLLQWIDYCRIKAKDKPLVRETLIQYSNLIKELTNQHMETLQKEQILSIMSTYPEAIGGIFEIGFDEFRNYLFEKFCAPEFEEEAIKRNLVFDISNALSCDKEVGFCFYSKDWQHSRIWINSEGSRRDFYIGIFNEGISKTKLKQVVSICQILQDKANIFLPIGSEYLEYKYQDWTQPSILSSFQSGEYVKYIMSFVDRIIGEINSRKYNLL